MSRILIVGGFADFLRFLVAGGARLWAEHRKSTLRGPHFHSDLLENYQSPQKPQIPGRRVFEPGLRRFHQGELERFIRLFICVFQK